MKYRHRNNLVRTALSVLSACTLLYIASSSAQSSTQLNSPALTPEFSDAPVVTSFGPLLSEDIARDESYTPEAIVLAQVTANDGPMTSQATPLGTIAIPTADQFTFTRGSDRDVIFIHWIDPPSNLASYELSLLIDGQKVDSQTQDISAGVSRFPVLLDFTYRIEIVAISKDGGRSAPYAEVFSTRFGDEIVFPAPSVLTQLLGRPPPPGFDAIELSVLTSTTMPDLNYTITYITDDLALNIQRYSQSYLQDMQTVPGQAIQLRNVVIPHSQPSWIESIGTDSDGIVRYAESKKYFFFNGSVRSDRFTLIGHLDTTDVHQRLDRLINNEEQSGIFGFEGMPAGAYTTTLIADGQEIAEKTISRAVVSRLIANFENGFNGVQFFDLTTLAANKTYTLLIVGKENDGVVNYTQLETYSTHLNGGITPPDSPTFRLEVSASRDQVSIAYLGTPQILDYTVTFLTNDQQELVESISKVAITTAIETFSEGEPFSMRALASSKVYTVIVVGKDDDDITRTVYTDTVSTMPNGEIPSVDRVEISPDGEEARFFWNTQEALNYKISLATIGQELTTIDLTVEAQEQLQGQFGEGEAPFVLMDLTPRKLSVLTVIGGDSEGVTRYTYSETINNFVLKDVPPPSAQEDYAFAVSPSHNAVGVTFAPTAPILDYTITFSANERAPIIEEVGADLMESIRATQTPHNIAVFSNHIYTITTVGVDSAGVPRVSFTQRLSTYPGGNFPLPIGTPPPPPIDYTEQFAEYEVAPNGEEVRVEFFAGNTPRDVGAGAVVAALVNANFGPNIEQPAVIRNIIITLSTDGQEPIVRNVGFVEAYAAFISRPTGFPISIPIPVLPNRIYTARVNADNEIPVFLWGVPVTISTFPLPPPPIDFNQTIHRYEVALNGEEIRVNLFYRGSYGIQGILGINVSQLTITLTTDGQEPIVINLSSTEVEAHFRDETSYNIAVLPNKFYTATFVGGGRDSRGDLSWDASETISTFPANQLPATLPPISINPLLSSTPESGLSTNTATVSWQDLLEGASYRLNLYLTSDSIAKSTIQSAEITTTNHTFTGLTPEQDYTVEITAMKNGMAVSRATPISFTTLRVILPQLGTPEIADTTVLGNTITVAWVGVDNVENYILNLYLGDGTSGRFLRREERENNAVNLTFSFRSLMPLTGYAVGIIARAENYRDSNPTTAIGTTGKANINPPTRNELVITPSTDNITVTFKNTQSGVTGYTLSIQKRFGDRGFVQIAQDFSLAMSPLTFTGLETDREYTLMARPTFDSERYEYTSEVVSLNFIANASLRLRLRAFLEGPLQ